MLHEWGEGVAAAIEGEVVWEKTLEINAGGPISRPCNGERRWLKGEFMPSIELRVGTRIDAN